MAIVDGLQKLARQMTRRRFVQALVGTGVGLVHSACGGFDDGSTRPNILLVGVDDMNDWVGWLGGHPQVQTPRLDALAARGTVFERAYCHVAACHPSRTTTLTGALPPTTGVYANGDWMTTPFPSLATIPAFFRQQGYKTLGAGKIFHSSGLTPHHLEPDGLWDEFVPFESSPNEDPFPKPSEAPWNQLVDSRSFHMSPDWIRQEDWFGVDRPPEDMPDGRIATAAQRWLARDHEAPFFMAIGFYRPHMPWYTPKPFFDLYPERIEHPGVLEGDLSDVPPAGRRLAPGWGTNRRFAEAGVEDAAARAYLASISFADWCVGEVLDALALSRHVDRTWIVFWSDNGFHLGEKEHWHKWTLWERSVRVPLIIAPPGSTKRNANRVVDPVGLVDLFPTMCELASLPAPGHLEGESLALALSNADFARTSPVQMFLGPSNHALRFGRWKYIRYEDGTEELYDIASDPDEFRNLASDPQSGDALGMARDHHRRLREQI